MAYHTHSRCDKAQRQRGSVLITAIIFAAVLSLALGGLINYTHQVNMLSKRNALREILLHLAESGIEIAMNDLHNDRVTGDFWKRENLSYTIDGHTAEIDLAIIPEGGTSSVYNIYSIASLPFSSGHLQRAIVVSVSKTEASSEDDIGTSQSGNFPYSIYAREDISIQHGNGDNRPVFASYNSDVTSDPELNVDTGYDASIVTPSDSNSAINVNNAIIHGTLNSGGGSVGYDSGRTNSNQLDQNLWLSLSDDDDSTSINIEGIQQSFNGTISDPEYPDTRAHLAPEGQSPVNDSDFWQQNTNNISFGADQNFWQNGSGTGTSELYSASDSSRTIGKSGESTVITTPSVTLQNNSTLHVKGDVVLIIKNNYNIHGDIHFEDGASLQIIASQNNHFTGSTDNPKPNQFKITPYVDTSVDSPSGPNVQFNNTDRIAVVINAPYSKVSTGGQGNGIFNYHGAIVANNFECPNGVNFFYDTTLNNGDDSSTDGTIPFWDSDPTYSMVSWNETTISKATSELESWGVDTSLE